MLLKAVHYLLHLCHQLVPLVNLIHIGETQREGTETKAETGAAIGTWLGLWFAVKKATVPQQREVVAGCDRETVIPTWEGEKVSIESRETEEYAHLARFVSPGAIRESVKWEIDVGMSIPGVGAPLAHQYLTRKLFASRGAIAASANVETGAIMNMLALMRKIGEIQGEANLREGG